MTEVSKFAKVTVVTDAVAQHDCCKVSDPSTWTIDPHASFFSFCVNETVNGIEFDWDTFPFHLIPRECAIVADMSSNIGTNIIPWEKLGMVYAGA